MAKKKIPAAKKTSSIRTSSEKSAYPDISTVLSGVQMKNPLVLSSGYLGTTASILVRSAREGAGAVTAKSCSLQPRAGHRNPTVISTDDFVMNAVGLSNPGAVDMEFEVREAVKGAGALGVPVFASIFGETISEYGEVAAIIAKAKPAILEVNVSCPNISNEGKMFGADVGDVQAVVYSVKDACGRIPVYVKLSPNVNDISKIAKAAIEAGADGITAINTLRGMMIDPIARKPVFTNITAGVSGPAIKPIALRCVYEIRKAVGPTVPIIGGGGIVSGRDAAEMILAGATAVGIGSAICYREKPFEQIAGELARFMQENNHAKLLDLKLQ